MKRRFSSKSKLFNEIAREREKPIVDDKTEVKVMFVFITMAIFIGVAVNIYINGTTPIITEIYIGCLFFMLFLYYKTS